MNLATTHPTHQAETLLAAASSSGCAPVERRPQSPCKSFKQTNTQQSSNFLRHPKLQPH